MKIKLFCTLFCMLMVIASTESSEIVLQQGLDSYEGCKTAVIWGSKAKMPKEKNAEILPLRGVESRILVKFDLQKMKGKKLARARLMLFAPSATVRTVCEICVSELMSPWDESADYENSKSGKKWISSGADFNKTSDYKNGRPIGCLDSESIWEYDGKYFSHRYAKMLVPKEGRWLSFNVSEAAKKWIADPASNNGVAVYAINLSDTRFPHNAVIDFPSPSSKDKIRRPKLVLDFEPVEPFLAGMTHTLSRFTDLDSLYKFHGPYTEEYELFMAKNEYAGFQVMIYPMISALKNVRFESSELVNSADKKLKISAADIQYNCVEIFKLFENQKVKDWYFHGYNPMTPDPLIWNKPMDCPLHIATPFWFTVKTSPNTVAGLYEGTITVKADNVPEKKLELKVRVWNYAIPEKWNFETMGQTCWGNISGYYGSLSKEMKRKYIDFLLDHRFSPTEQYIDKLSPD